jgi:hypothetical protein
MLCYRLFVLHLYTLIVSKRCKGKKLTPLQKGSKVTGFRFLELGDPSPPISIIRNIFSDFSIHHFFYFIVFEELYKENPNT